MDNNLGDLVSTVIGGFRRSPSTAVRDADLRRRHHWVLTNLSLTQPRVQQNTMKKSLIVSFHDAWWVRISITTQYNNIYVINKQLVVLVFPLVFL